MTDPRPHHASGEGVLEDRVMELAETTDVSPRQARELLRRHRGDFDGAKREAANFKAES